MSDKTFADIRTGYRQTMYLTLTVLILFSLGWAWFALTPTPIGRSLMTVDSVTYETEPLCPGETLTYTYTVHIAAPGVYTFDASVWGVEQQQVVQFGESLRIAAASKQDTQLVRHWDVPPMYYDTLVDAPQWWQPGRYERHIAVTAVGRDTQASLEIIPFVIRDGCN